MLDALTHTSRSRFASTEGGKPEHYVQRFWITRISRRLALSPGYSAGMHEARRRKAEPVAQALHTGRSCGNVERGVPRRVASEHPVSEALTAHELDQ
jgi:hypothetical protein